MSDIERIARLEREVALESGSKYRNGTNGAPGSGGLVRINVTDLRWLLDCYNKMVEYGTRLAEIDAAEHHPDA